MLSSIVVGNRKYLFKALCMLTGSFTCFSHLLPNVPWIFNFCGWKPLLWGHLQSLQWTYEEWLGCLGQKGQQELHLSLASLNSSRTSLYACLVNSSPRFLGCPALLNTSHSPTPITKWHSSEVGAFCLQLPLSFPRLRYKISFFFAICLSPLFIPKFQLSIFKITSRRIDRSLKCIKNKL